MLHHFSPSCLALVKTQRHRKTPALLPMKTTEMLTSTFSKQVLCCPQRVLEQGSGVKDMSKTRAVLPSQATGVGSDYKVENICRAAFRNHWSRKWGWRRAIWLQQPYAASAASWRTSPCLQMSLTSMSRRSSNCRLLHQAASLVIVLTLQAGVDSYLLVAVAMSCTVYMA